MNTHNDENGVWFSNDKKADKYAEANPEQYQQLLTKLAELEDVREKIKELRYYETEIVSEISELEPPYKATFGGIGIVTVSKSKSKKWDNDALMPVIVARALDDRRIDKETGEVLEREAWAVARVLKECAGIGYWRLQALEDYGIQADEYYETTSTKPSVRIQS